MRISSTVMTDTFRHEGRSITMQPILKSGGGGKPKGRTKQMKENKRRGSFFK